MTRAGDVARWTGRAFRAAVLVVFVVMTASGTVRTTTYITDIRLQVIGIGILATSAGWLMLALATRARGAPWPWLAFAVAWGAFPAIWLALTGGLIFEPVVTAIGRAAEAFGPDVAQVVPNALIAPLIEEPVKVLGVGIAFSAARRSGAALSAALGAAIGGLVGMAFGIAEAAQHIGVIVNQLGFVDLDGSFVIDGRLVQQVTEVELLRRFYFLGLANHALFSALAGASLALFLLHRRRLAGACFAAALLAHGATNAFGGPIMNAVVEALGRGVGPLGRGSVPLPVGVWLAAVCAFVITEGWAALVLVRVLRSTGLETGLRRAGLEAEPPRPGPEQEPRATRP